MKKKVLMFVMALFVLFAVAPVIAAPAVKMPYTAVVDLTVTDLGVVWVTDDGILQVRGQVAEGPFNSIDLGIIGIMQKEYDLTCDLATGEGTIRGKFLLEVEAIGTLKGSFRGIITDYTLLEGTVVGHGTGAFEGYKTMGTWEGEIIGGTQIVNVLDAILLIPKP